MTLSNKTSKESIFLTGGTGYLGLVLANKLQSQGYNVKALVRETAKSQNASSFNPAIKKIQGDLLHIDSFIHEVKNCTVLIHGAALVKIWVKDKSLYYRINVKALEELFWQASELGISKIIYISSFIALGPSDDKPLLTEKNYHPADVFRNDYEKSKYLGDKKAEELIEKGLPIIRLYPGVIYGPGKLTEGNIVAKIIIDYLKGKTPGIICGNTLWSYSYIYDVINGILAAMQKGKPGERYILGGENKTLRELYDFISQSANKKPLSFNIPAWLASSIGFLYWTLAELFNKEPEFTHQVINIFRHNWACSSQKAIDELDYSITPFSVGMKSTYDWIKTIL